jgi:diaminopimelate decarboxylase
MYCERVKVSDIVRETGTPAYIYSKRTILDAYREFDSAFESINHLVCYSMKANMNLSICSILGKAGSGIDAHSGGELYRALKAGVDPKKIIFSGVGKTLEEIRYALEQDILMFTAESRSELRAINALAGELGKKAPISIRINPDVDPHTHPYIATGLSENKFGIDSALAFDAFNQTRSMPNLEVVGLNMHIGSQITQVEPFIEAATKMAVLVLELKKAEFNIRYFDIGGGMAISYRVERPPRAKDIADAILPILNVTDCRIVIEPGRYLVGNAGILVTTVLYTKKHRKKNFVIVDAGMNDLIRPSLYDAFHKIKSVSLKNEDTMIADIVGPVCETGDFFARAREVTKCKQGDLFAIMSAGAYGYSMSSNYNARRRPPEVIVDGDKFYVTRERETYEDMVMKEKIVDELVANLK